MFDIFPFLVTTKHSSISCVSVVISILSPITEVDHALGQYSYNTIKSASTPTSLHSTQDAS